MTDPEPANPELGELIRLYRGAAQRRDEAECMRLLKALHGVDPGNRSWLVDLERFRKKRLASIERECREAMRKDDAARVWLMLDELSGYEGLKAGTVVKRAAAEFLRGKRRDEGDADGRKARDELARCREAGDLGGTVAALGLYRDIVALGLYKQTAADKRLARQAAAWVGRQQVKQQRLEAFRSKMKELEKELSAPRSGPTLDALLKELGEFSNPIPENLRRRTEESILACHRRERRRTRLRRLSWGSAFALVLLSLGAAAWWLGLQRAEKHWAGRLEAAFSRTDLVGFRQVKQALPAGRPGLYGPALAATAEVKEWLAREDELVRAFEARLAGQQRVLQAFQARRDADFDGTRVEIETLISEGRKIALNEDVLQAVANFERDWREAKQAQMKKILQRIADAAPTTDAIDTSRLPVIQARLGEIRAWIAEGRAVEPVPDELTAKLDSWDKKIAGFDERVAGIQEALKALRSSKTLDGYLQGVRAYTEKGTGDQLSEPLSKILALAKDYTYLVAWPPAAAYRPGTAHIPFETTPLGRYYPLMGEQNYFWSGLLRDLEDLDQTLALTWPKVKRTIGLLGDDGQLTELYQYTDGLSGELIFVEGALYDLQPGAAVPPETSGQMYKPGPLDTSPVFSFRKVMREHVHDPGPMAHCVFLKDLVTEAAALSDSEADEFLLRKMLALYTDTKIVNPLLKLKLIRFLAQQFTELKIAGRAAEVQELLRALQRVDDSAAISWLCVKNAALASVNDRAASVVRHHLQSEDASWLSEYRFERLLRSACAGRGAQFVGTVDMTSRRPSVLPGRAPPELWVLRRQPKGEMAVYVAADRSDSAAYEATVPLVPGEPLFGPGGSVSSAATLARCLELAGLKQSPEGFLWPAAWPVNRRR